MERNHEQFEDYLRQFAPRPPAPLVSETAGHQWRRFAAAAGIVIAVAGSAWLGPHQRPAPATMEFVAQAPNGNYRRLNQVTLGELRRLANDPEQLDTALAETSRQELPDFRETSSALRALAKE